MCPVLPASNVSLDSGNAPIFQVVSTRKKFEVSVSKIEQNAIHFTQICLLDGSGDVMVGLVVHSVGIPPDSLADVTGRNGM
jgi:hypothetical protein